jgi:hypothetical protein
LFEIDTEDFEAVDDAALRLSHPADVSDFEVGWGRMKGKGAGVGERVGSQKGGNVWVGGVGRDDHELIGVWARNKLILRKSIVFEKFETGRLGILNSTLKSENSKRQF